MNSFATRFVSSIIDAAIKNETQKFNKFGLLLGKSGFDFKKHQFNGVKWCVQNEVNGSITPVLFEKSNGSIKGGIIADEMGLGKTILMIGTMFMNFLPKTIIVVPPILIEQWANEIYKSSGHKALVYYGIKKASIGSEELAKACIVITSYNTLLPNHTKQNSNVLFGVKWDRIIFDEAHHLRNARTTRFASCKQLVAPIKWLVSGTPIQNKRSDFYSLCNMLGFKPEFYKNIDNVDYIVHNHILRRTKADVGIELPPVNIQNIIVPWKSINEKILSEEIHSLIPNQTGVSYSKGNAVADLIAGDGRYVILRAILRARQSCVLPALMKTSIQSCISADKTGVYLDALEYTSKLDAVVKMMLGRKDNGKGKIVFCHYIDEIDMIAKRLRDGGMSNVVTYDGRNSGTSSKLAESADAIVLQIQTGCEGLNLQKFFSEIYFVSPHWNPAVEDQAIARCHRIGQVSEVNVFRFEMDGFDRGADQDFIPITLDKYVSKVQGGKRDIALSLLC